MSIPTGKGIWLWQIWRQEGGSIDDPKYDEIVEAVVAAGASFVVIKAADGVYPYNVRWGNYPYWSGGIIDDLAKELTLKLQRALVQVIGYHYVRGFRPLDEAAVMVDRVSDLGLDGVSIDAEKEYKREDYDDEADAYMDALTAGVGDLSISLASYRFPSLHRALPYEQFLSGCDHNAPQMYWQGAHNPVAQLDRCIDEYDDIYAGAGMQPLPMVPIGSGYGEHGWVARPADITAFLQGCVDRNLPGASLWSYDWMRNRGPELWSAFADFEWLEDDAPPPGNGDDTKQQLLDVASGLRKGSQSIIEAADTIVEVADEL